MKHNPRMLRESSGDMKLAGCSCGWQYTDFRQDPDDALVMHIAVALLRIGSSAEAPSGTYRHFKGGHYTVLGTAIDARNGGTVVLYCDDKQLFTRALGEFLDTVEHEGEQKPRFTRIDR